ncbi:MAG: transposase [Deltaproteobacteria bacterium]|jgi:transposase|nr:transposase [Deltaproteobacteria bacterium]
MKKLAARSSSKVFLAADSLRAHHSEKAAALLKNHHDRIVIFRLPPYPPEPDPDEHLKSILKSALRKLPRPHEQEELNSNVRKTLKGAQNGTKKVKKHMITANPAVPKALS